MSDLEFSDSEEGEYEYEFNEATKYVQQNHDKILLNPTDLLEFYGLYKQATVGECNVEKPGIFNMQQRAKWSAWHALGKMTKDDAKRAYIDKVQKYDPNWSKSFVGQNKSAFSWVVHSMLAPPENMEVEKPEVDKTSFDYVKEGNLNGLTSKLLPNEYEKLDENGMGLLHWAADRNHCDILEMLLNAGVNVNFRDGEQQTALHYAASCGHLECLRILLKYNADRHAKDVDGQTCLDVAENSEVRQLLEKL